MRILWRLTKLVAGTLRFLLRGGVLLVILAMLALNVATLAFAPLGAAAGALLARAGITTVADSVEVRAAAAERRALAAERRVASQADELAAARRRVALQSDELARLSHVRYRGQSRTIRAAVADTADRIASRTATATARNLAAMPAEALPIFGIAVIAGATAWELGNACALMQDMHELNVAFDPALANDPGHYEACGIEVPTPDELWEWMIRDPAAALDAQPEEYGSMPAFDEPGWWDRAMSRFRSEAGVRPE